MVSGRQAALDLLALPLENRVIRARFIGAEQIWVPLVEALAV